MDETIMSCDRCGRQKHHTFWAIHGFLDPDGDPIDLCVLCMIVLSQYKTLVDNWGDRTPPLGKINQLLYDLSAEWDKYQLRETRSTTHD